MCGKNASLGQCPDICSGGALKAAQREHQHDRKAMRTPEQFE
jgi:hypothetical protein